MRKTKHYYTVEAIRDQLQQIASELDYTRGSMRDTALPAYQVYASELGEIRQLIVRAEQQTAQVLQELGG